MRTRLPGPLMALALMALAALLLASPVMAEPRQVWKATGFKTPESVIYDLAGELIYVSNVNGEPGVKDGNGFISKLDPAGRIEQLEWVKGLDAPTGMTLANGALYVADVDRLVAIDVATGEIVARYEAKGARLNDVTADTQARIFVSDILTNRIWMLDGESFQLWVDDPALDGPNGLLAENTRLVVASWGTVGEGSGEKVLGHLKTVDLATKAVGDLGRGEPLGNLDGLVSDGSEGYFATDWSTGTLLHVAADGTATKALTLGQGTADLGIVPELKVVLIPMMRDDRVVAYRLE
jgi:DNA-binding beta-propeller fold protein YncE